MEQLRRRLLQSTLFYDSNTLESFLSSVTFRGTLVAMLALQELLDLLRDNGHFTACGGFASTEPHQAASQARSSAVSWPQVQSEAPAVATSEVFPVGSCPSCTQAGRASSVIWCVFLVLLLRNEVTLPLRDRSMHGCSPQAAPLSVLREDVTFPME